MSTHDLVIRGATLVDGTGSAACIAAATAPCAQHSRAQITLVLR
jgi:hypothetical protein